MVSVSDPTGERPATTAQDALWLAQMLEPETSNNIAGYLDIRAAVDVPAMLDAMVSVIDEAESLACVFTMRDGELTTAPLRKAPWRPDFVDVSGDEDPQRSADELLAALAAKPFRLDRDRLVHTTLVKIHARRCYLIFVSHHIVNDGVGSALLGKRLVDVYSAAVHGLEPPPSGYASADEIHREFNSYRNSRRYERDREYWREITRQARERIRLPGSGQSKSKKTIRASAIVDEPAADRIRALAERLGASLPMLLTASACVLFRGHLRRESFYTQVALSNRRGGSRRTPGLFANRVPLPVSFAPQVSFREFCADLSQRLRRAIVHGRYPLSEISREAAWRGPAAFGPTISVMPAFGRLDLPGGTVDIERLSGTADELMATVTYDPSGHGSLAVQFDADARYYSEADLVAYAERWQVVLDAVAADPDAPVSEVELLSAGERDRVLFAWNDTCMEVERPSVWEQFTARASETPDALAVLDADGSRCGYAELAARATQVMATLLDRDIGPESVVAVVMERSADLAAVWLGVLATGAACLPIDPEYPTERISWMLTDAAPAVVISHRADAYRFESAEVLVLDDLVADVPASDIHDRLVRPRPQNSAYVIYTSGSTGQPKSVAVTHRNLVNLLAVTEQSGKFGPDDVWAWAHSPAFDVSVWELLGALVHGATVVVAGRRAIRDPDMLWRLVVETGVTVLNQTPSAAYRLIEAADRLAVPAPSLRMVIFAGEALCENRVIEWPSGADGSAPTLVNMYGLTECAVHLTRAQVGDTRSEASVIGTPIGNVRTLVLDDRLRPAPIGVAGELYIGGAQVARGYRGRPGLSAARFVADPFGSGDRLYRSGDLARWTPRRELEFLGRADEQVKLHGFRVEPAEVRAALLSHPRVSEAAVAVRDAVGHGARRLVGYVVVNGPESVDAQQIRRYVGSRLPEFMVPQVVRIDRIPLTVNGKLDVSGLPDVAPGGGARYRTPHGRAEQTLARLFAEVLGVERVGADDSFFDLGGSSLAASRLTTLIQVMAGVRLPVQAVYDLPTVAGLARRLEGARYE
ncbi:amino acid adenylation domain-containing protein [Nocardia sp. NPDC127526]|uniref:non-ribosomal peptide synthetase n=1 Tax=Nocardia sp. NPDC127526 TaxID=3345393 RepID=UPI0036432441